MALICNKCKWQQDEFWSSEYSPIHGECFDELRSVLIKALEDQDSKMIAVSSSYIDEHPECPYKILDESVGTKDIRIYVEFRDFIAEELESRARSIRNMRWPTKKDCAGGVKCPKCGNKLSID